jgi:lysophospholipase L1-like esterase
MKTWAHPLLTIVLLVGFYLNLPIAFGQPSTKSTIVRNELNYIVLPSDSFPWIEFARKLHRMENNPHDKLVILHMGDSHIQGDYFTGEVRKRFLGYFKTIHPARGMYFPYQLAHSNGPDEISIRLNGTTLSSSLRKPIKPFYPLTGYCIKCKDSVCDIDIKDSSGFHFNEVIIYHSPCNNNQLELKNASRLSTILIHDSMAVTKFRMNNLQNRIILQLRNSDHNPVYLYGISYENSQEQFLYHSIGINGATFSTLLQAKAISEFVSFIHPDCIVISCGTNDALDRNMNPTHERAQITRLIEIIHNISPNLLVILTTPGDHLIRKRYNNPRLLKLSNIIKEVALKKQCAYWDFYNIMGGNGSIYQWRQHQLVFQDYIHMSKKGYKLQGDLFFEALRSIPTDMR